MTKFILSLICIMFWLPLSAVDHPRIFASDKDKVELKHKIAGNSWAAEIYSNLKSKIDPYVIRHKGNPEWIVSRLAMYWKDGEHYTQCYLKNEVWDYGVGNAPVPTVRMPGQRTWNKYVNVPLEERTPYNQSGDMWGVSISDPSSPKVLVPYKESGHMIRANNVEILTLAEEAAFLYWLTDDRDYAKFASDIFYTWLLGTYYMNPILDPGESSKGKGGNHPGGILGYYDYEQIHDDLGLHAATIYDFAYDYLSENQPDHLSVIGKELPHVAGEVFKCFIDIGFVRGGKSGNWNVNGWNMMLRPILALEDDDFYPDHKGRSYYLHYLTTESTPYHDAIPDILDSYDKVTGLWPESPGYSFGTIAMLLEFSSLLRNFDIDLIGDNTTMQKAALAVFPWMDPRGNMIVFGDSRGGAANFSTFEHLLSYYQSNGDVENASKVADAIATGISNGSYDRSKSNWTALCLFTDSISIGNSTGGKSTERISYSPHHRLVTMKSDDNKLMAVLYGGRDGYHLSPNGLALQLYGFGYALSPDAAGYESYWSKDKAYHQTATGSNTVLPGYTHGEVTVNLMEPALTKNDFTGSHPLSPYINVCDMSAGEKRRVAVVIDTPDGDGYYIDIFRSDLNDNDYLFHNVGKSLQLYTPDGKIIECKPIEKIDNGYGIDYSWFENVSATHHDGGFHAVWDASGEDTSIKMHMWMNGATGRQLFTISAPYTTLNKSLTPNGLSAAPLSTPTLIVRQESTNGWKTPFISVFQPVSDGCPSVKSSEVMLSDSTRTAIKISSGVNRTDIVFSAISPESFAKVGNCQFSGLFGFVSEDSGNVTQLLMLEGTQLTAGNFAIKATAPMSACIYLKEGVWYYSADSDCELKIGRKKYMLKPGYNMELRGCLK